MVVLWCVVAPACGDDVGTGTGDGSSSDGGDTTFASADVSGPSGSASATSGPTATATATTVDPDSSGGSGSSGVEGSSSGGELDPFGPPQAHALAIDFDPLALALGDFDGDGVLDLLVTGTQGGVVAAATLQGDGAGGFGDPIDATVPACSAFPVVGAIDDDGIDDLFYGTCDAQGVFARGNGDGTFSPADVIASWTSGALRSSRFADFDGDDRDDLVMLTVDAGGDGVQLHLALATDDATPWPISSTTLATPPGFEPAGLELAQVDGSAAVDVVLVDDGALGVVRSVAGPGWSPLEVLSESVAPFSIDAADIDASGTDELLVTSRADHALQPLLRIDGAYVAQAAFDLPSAPFDAAIGGHADAIGVVLEDLPTLSTLRIDTTSAIVSTGSHDLDAPAVRLLAGDLDGDGDDDLVAATFAAGSVTVLLAQ